jgi:ribosomal protein S18 acetylase RimI-like enzyme
MTPRFDASHRNERRPLIERLTTNLEILARSSVAELASERGRRVVADCADAIRLELDCPQQELDANQRELLVALGDRLEEGGDPADVRALARRVRSALGRSTVTFRRATNADVAVAQAIVREALGNHGLDLLLETSDKDLLDLERHYDAHGGAFELISLGSSGDPVGVLGWRPGFAGTMEINKVYLLRSARGHGVGRIAVERVIDQARARGLQAVVLETAHAMTDAISLYTRLGFRPVSGEDAAAFANLGDDCEQAFRLDLQPG